jgi:hypothetical protein
MGPSMSAVRAVWSVDAPRTPRHRKIPPQKRDRETQPTKRPRETVPSTIEGLSASDDADNDDSDGTMQRPRLNHQHTLVLRVTDTFLGIPRARNLILVQLRGIFVAWLTRPGDVALGQKILEGIILQLALGKGDQRRPIHLEKLDHDGAFCAHPQQRMERLVSRNNPPERCHRSSIRNISKCLRDVFCCLVDVRYRFGRDCPQLWAFGLDVCAAHWARAALSGEGCLVRAWCPPAWYGAGGGKRAGAAGAGLVPGCPSSAVPRRSRAPPDLQGRGSLDSRVRLPMVAQLAEALAWVREGAHCAAIRAKLGDGVPAEPAFGRQCLQTCGQRAFYWAGRGGFCSHNGVRGALSRGGSCTQRAAGP